MDLSFSKEDLDFRQDVVDFLDNNYPDDIKERQDKRLPLDKEQNIRWQKILSNQGWFAVNWPEEYSGTPELTLTQKYILQNVLAEYNTPVQLPFGVGMCGPVIYTFGTDKQKEQHLPSSLKSHRDVTKLPKAHPCLEVWAGAARWRHRVRRQAGGCPWPRGVSPAARRCA